MALTDTELQDIIDRLSPEDRKLLLSQLGRQVEVDIVDIDEKPKKKYQRKKKEPESLDEIFNDDKFMRV